MWPTSQMSKLRLQPHRQRLRRMPRMRGKDMIRKISIWLCSFLLIVVIVLWITSWIWMIEIHVPRRTPGAYITITNLGGCISIMNHKWIPARVYSHYFNYMTVSEFNYKASWTDPPIIDLKERPYFEWKSFNFTTKREVWSGHSLRFPHWLPTIIFAIYPTIAFIRGPYSRYYRRRKGLCLNCGYNLTGNVSGVCPECGTPLDPELPKNSNNE